MIPASYDHLYTRPPMVMKYKGFNVTGVVPEDASSTDEDFIAWAERADQIIASGHSREWIEDRLSSLTYG